MHKRGKAVTSALFWTMTSIFKKKNKDNMHLEITTQFLITAVTHYGL